MSSLSSNPRPRPASRSPRTTRSRSGASGPPEPAPPLVVTGEESLREELLRLAAAAGVVPDVVADPTAALRSWARAPLVVVGGDVAEALARLAPGRRDGVHVVSWGPVASELFRAGLALGAEDVAELPGSRDWLVELLTDVGDAGRAGGRVVGVVGGSGGAGATTLACALGQAAALHGDAVVVDCDPLGPGVDRVLGLDGAPGFRWDALCQTTGRLSARSLRQALPRRRALGVLGWYSGTTATLQPFAVREALSAARRGHDTVVLDLPRGGGPLVEEVAARCDHLVVVVVPTLVGVASAARLCARFEGHARLSLVVRSGGLDPLDVAQTVRAPVVLTLPDQRGLQEAVDLGLGPLRSPRVPLARSCRDLLGLLGARETEPAGVVEGRVGGLADGLVGDAA